MCKKNRKEIIMKLKIEEVQIGLDTARKKLRYYDTNNLVTDLDLAFKISIPDIIDNEDVYFENEQEAKNFIKERI